MIPGVNTQWHAERILIVVKTYPEPSRKYRETSCTGGVTQVNGIWTMRRLYPIPYRLLDGEKQFKKWDWVTLRVRKSTSDPRPESYHIDPDTISIVDHISDWGNRRVILENLLIQSLEELDHARRLGGSQGPTTGMIRPKEIFGLRISKGEITNWDNEDYTWLQQELSLEQETQVRRVRPLPYDFHFEFRCDDPACSGHRIKISDWELSQLFWNCYSKYGSEWEIPFRKKAEEDLLNRREVFLLMGNLRIHPHVWIIGGVFYPPKDWQPPLISMYSNL